MKLSSRLLITIIMLSSFLNSEATRGKPKFKVVAYYSLKSAMTDSLENIPFDKLTHINLWFLNPDTAGNFAEDFSALAPFIDAAHNKKVKVLASIGGGSPHPYYHALLRDDK